MQTKKQSQILREGAISKRGKSFGDLLHGLVQVSLGNGCVYTGIVMHELMHATGFWHEQSRADRDRHITINWDNIQVSPVSIAIVGFFKFYNNTEISEMH